MLREIEYTESNKESTIDSPQKRSWIWAFVLSYFVVGWGQAYNGQYIKGLAIVSFNLFTVAIFAFEIAPSDQWGILFIIFDRVVPVFATVDAILNVNNPIANILAKKKTILIYVTILIFTELIYWLPVPKNSHFFNPLYRWQMISVEDVWMEPTIMKGRDVRIDALYYDRNKVDRGDMVVFVEPNKTERVTDKNIIMRVIAFAGEKVTIQNKKILINDKFREDFYYDRTNCHTMRDGYYGIVPADSVFVMADACVSATNGSFGWYVPLLSIKGKVIRIDKW